MDLLTKDTELVGINEYSGFELTTLKNEMEKGELISFNGLTLTISGQNTLIREEANPDTEIKLVRLFQDATGINPAEVEITFYPTFKGPGVYYECYITPILVVRHEETYYPVFAFLDDRKEDHALTKAHCAYIKWWCEKYQPEFVPYVYDYETDTVKPVTSDVNLQDDIDYLNELIGEGKTSVYGIPLTVVDTIEYAVQAHRIFEATKDLTAGQREGELLNEVGKYMEEHDLTQILACSYKVEYEDENTWLTVY